MIISNEKELICEVFEVFKAKNGRKPNYLELKDIVAGVRWRIASTGN
ncbi:MAG: hypothetical protein KKF78_03480 [Candidatus Omnitrophica bacterium]|nr:hypothetical protein [Candidatus Omnitrophota bacterium]MBU1996200.1 hypothetical protein [Candidatus Omnitrophota bacterium]